MFFAMGPDAVDQVGFKGNVYAQIQKSKMFRDFWYVQLQWPIARNITCRPYCSFRYDAPQLYAFYVYLGVVLCLHACLT